MSKRAAGDEGREPDVVIVDDIASDETLIDRSDARTWLDEALARHDGSVVAFGFRLPADVADRFAPGDFVGPILEAHYRDAIEWQGVTFLDGARSPFGDEIET